MKDELTSKMHSEFKIDSETEISHRVGVIVEELQDTQSTLKELLEDYGTTLTNNTQNLLKRKKLPIS